MSMSHTAFLLVASVLTHGGFSESIEHWVSIKCATTLQPYLFIFFVVCTKAEGLGSPTCITLYLSILDSTSLYLSHGCSLLRPCWSIIPCSVRKLCFLFLVCFIVFWGRMVNLVTFIPECPEAGVSQLAFCVSFLMYRDNIIGCFRWHVRGVVVLAS